MIIVQLAIICSAVTGPADRCVILQERFGLLCYEPTVVCSTNPRAELTKSPCSMCSKNFKVPSKIAAHIESGGCNPNINRHHVSAAIHAMHISPPITIALRIEGPINPVVHFSATDMAFNGKAYEYYLCHVEFSTLQSLNLHLNSPVHDANEFKCPKTTMWKEVQSRLGTHPAHRERILRFGEI